MSSRLNIESAARILEHRPFESFKRKCTILHTGCPWFSKIHRCVGRIGQFSALATGLQSPCPGAPMMFECSYSLTLAQPYDQARRRILATLKHRGLQLAFDFDVASGILRSVGVKLPRSSVLGVGCPYQFLEAFIADPAAAVFFPLHVVLSEHGPETQVRILAPQTLLVAGISPAISIPVHRTLGRIREALASIGACSAKRSREGPSSLANAVLHEILEEEVR